MWIARVPIIVVCVGSLAWVPGAIAEQTEAGRSAEAPDDAVRKAEILGSDSWRRAMFELSEWLRVQSVYPPDEVARIKSEFSARVERMSADELKSVLADLEAKFRVLDTQEAREVRAWLGNYLSIISNRRRDELLKMIPDFATMDSRQLQETIDRLTQHRESRVRQRTQREELAASKTNPWAAAATSPRPAPRRTAYQSPYRPPTTQRPFDDVQIGPSRGMGIDPYGRIWMSMGF